MDGEFQGVTRISLTPAEEALVPRPHSSASQVATALPPGYGYGYGNGRRGSALQAVPASASASQLHLHHLHHHQPHHHQPLRSQLSRKQQNNHPYSSGSQGSRSRIFSFSFSSSSINTRPQQQQQQSPSSPSSSTPSSPSTPTNNAFSSTHAEHSAAVEIEYPQNPQDSYYQHQYPTPVYSSSPIRASHVPNASVTSLILGLPPRRSLTLSPPSQSNDNNDPLDNGNNSALSLRRSSLMPFPTYYPQSSIHSTSPTLHPPLQLALNQRHQESWGGTAAVSSFRVESPTPLSDSESSEEQFSDDGEEDRKGKRTKKKKQKKIEEGDEEEAKYVMGNHGYGPRRSRSRGILGIATGSTCTLPNVAEEGAYQTRSSVDSYEYRMQHQQQQPTHLTEHRRNRSSWRPSLSLIRQESSSCNVHPLEQGQNNNKSYPQNDQSRVSEAHIFIDDHPEGGRNIQPLSSSLLQTKNGKRMKKKKKGRTKKTQKSRSHSGGNANEAIVELPHLVDVLEKRARYPLGYEDFEAFLRCHQGVEYLNFWADVTAHEQLCKTFRISERRLQREQQHGGRALTRERRGYHSSRALAGNNSGGRTSFEKGQTLLNESGDVAAVDSDMHEREQDRISIDPLGNLRSARKSSTAIEYLGNGIRHSTSQQFSPTTPSPLLQSQQQQEPEILQQTQHQKVNEGPFPRRSCESTFPSSSAHNAIQDNSIGRPMMIHSFRTIGIEDVEESALRIYRKYLVQLRTASMIAEEEKARPIRAAATITDLGSKTERGAGIAATGNEGLSTSSHQRRAGNDGDRVLFGPGWDGYAEQVIAEWNEKWKSRRSAEARRRKSRRASRRHNGANALQNPMGVEGHDHSTHGKEGRASPTNRVTIGHNDVVLDVDVEEKGESPGADDKGNDYSAVPNKKEAATAESRRPKLERKATSTGITAFLSRLLKSETTVMELPTLTINTTTVEKDFGETDDSDYDEDDEYDDDESDRYDGDEDEDEDVKDGNEDDLYRLYAPIMSYLQSNTTERPLTDSSIAGYPPVPEIGANGSAIQAQNTTLVNTLSPINEALLTTALTPPQGVAPSTSDSANTNVVDAMPLPLHSIPKIDPISTDIDQPTITASTMAPFYLPLECRHRIHTQVLQQMQERQNGLSSSTRTENNFSLLFGPAKQFVTEVVLRDYYYPLFLKYVQDQNLGLLHQTHVNNRIKQHGLLTLGIGLWAAVLTIQSLLALGILGGPGYGGWKSPWVWVVGILGGWPGAVCIVAGHTGFSPVLGLLGKM
ncbi:hypothetical protein BX616_002720 [Lobosporangium transversale]|nr:hypothetical protein BX616_002720 [Lobosporangium transversale]